MMLIKLIFGRGKVMVKGRLSFKTNRFNRTIYKVTEIGIKIGLSFGFSGVWRTV
ncbi:hypothetical protein [Salipaludibacillus aurantiacus]|uniref:Uncharacterized protein n=1 Tax=Salipaludibacillus aurantiacus TaxID=1601833 RepID=A0A1H9UBL1_9BACI|nr:hypothetical protein [Salipaludibacillus aurantiacus]SES06845.1 hypothetical protein SAMN05518684_107108 [Salipaludibacillus aurantiacus]